MHFIQLPPALALPDVYHGRIAGPILRVLMLPHPSMRADLNPIEHVWKEDYED